VAKIIKNKKSNIYRTKQIKNFLLSSDVWEAMKGNIKFKDHLISNIVYMYTIMDLSSIKQVEVQNIDLSVLH
jgi:hypothetical protein